MKKGREEDKRRLGGRREKGEQGENKGLALKGGERDEGCEERRKRGKKTERAKVRGGGKVKIQIEERGRKFGREGKGEKRKRREGRMEGRMVMR